MKQKQSEQFNSKKLPNDVVFDIFTRLPVKTLVRLMCVSKLWKSKITSTDFLNKHLNDQAKVTKYDNNGFLLYQYRKWSRLCRYVYNNNHTLTKISRSETPGDLKCYCNGIFCIKILDEAHENKNLYLWNQCLRDFSKIIHLGSFNGPSEQTYFGLAYSQNNEFNVFGIDSENSEKADLFTLNTRGEVTNRTIETWVESLGRPVSYMSANPLLFFNGSLHCLARCRYPTFRKKFILSFDANDETFQEIKLPEFYFRNNGTSSEDLIVFQGSLALITYNEYHEAFHIRVMKEYGNVDSWNEMVVRATEHPRKYPEWEKVEKVYGCTKNGELLCWKKDGVFSFDIVTKEERDLGIGIPRSLYYTTTVFESLLFCR